MAKRNPTRPLSKDEKVIGAHMKLLEADMGAVNNLVSAANDSAETAREVGEEIPALQTQVNAVINKVAEMTTEFTAAEGAYREASIAAAGGDKADVESKAGEASSHFQRLKQLDTERKTLFDAVQKAAEKERPFREAVDKIESIQKNLQSLLSEANDKVSEAQEAVNEANSRLPVGALPEQAKTVAEKAQSLTSPAREAKTRLHEAKRLVSNLTTHLGTVSAALNSANNAASSKDKAAADTALENAKVAERKAEKAAGTLAKEKEDESQPAPQSPVATGGHEEEVSIVEKLPMSLWGRLVAMGAMFIAILWVAPDRLKPIFGMVWVVMVVLSFTPGIGKNPRWQKAFWLFAGAIALYTLFAHFYPVFTGGEPIVEALRSGAVDPTPTPEECRTGWFDDPCAD